MENVLYAIQFDFMRNALAAGLLVSLAAGIVGVYVVLNRVTILSGGIAHAAYGGVGIAYFFGFDPLLGGIILGLLRSEATWYFSARWQETVTFLLLGLFLIFRPNGILGKKQRLEVE